MDVTCPACGATVGEEIGGKLAIGLAGMLAGSRVNPLIAVLFGLLGAAIGHAYIDSAIRTCPQCGTVLKIVGGLPIW